LAGAFRFVIARHSRSKNGVASLAYDRAIQYSVSQALSDKTATQTNGCPAFAGHDEAIAIS
jgi:hypothetical protein